jgi:OmcA/MtrC family decaheme c-type cytochrome
MNGGTGDLSLTIDSVQTVSSTATLTFTIKPAAAVCPAGVCDPTLSKAVIGQQTFYAQVYNPATNTFDTKGKNFSFGSVAFKGLTADGLGAQYTAKKTSAPFAPETSANAFVYAYVTGLAAFAAPSTGHYYLPTSVASAAKVFNGTGTNGALPYTSSANVSGCEKCHGAPYSKHGYRQARIAGVPELPDFAACKACHTDQRVGADGQWFVLVDDPASYDPNNWDTTKYAYTANIMNDVHNSHAMEFNYPQSMANCVTCHANKLTAILTDANFKPSVCKSCHPVTGKGGTQDGRAPSFVNDIWGSSSHMGVTDLYSAAENACNGCHKTGGIGPTFAALHSGFNGQIYADAASANAGTQFSATRKAQIDSASFDAVAFVATVAFEVAGVPTNAVVVPTVVASLYGYDSKDFIVSGHSSSPKIECTGVDAACTGALTVTAGASPNTWVATINLATWSAQLTAKQVKQMEVGVLPTIAIDPTQAVSTTTGNLAAVVTGVTKTIDVSKTAANALIADANVYGKTIVDAANCNKCHDALGTTFHNPNYGSAGTVGCRLCHWVGSGSSHLEMQSRSIDSFVHAVHAMQEFDIKYIDPLNAVSNVRYEKHIEGVYPNFAGALNCESCHNKSTYDVPDQAKSLPSLISKSSNFFGNYPRTVGTSTGNITGPGARACGGCHRAQLINEEDGSSLAAFFAHTNGFSSNIPLTGVSATDNTNFLNTAAYIEYLVGAGPSATAVPGAQAEQCVLCHATAGSDHQATFNIWKNGL